MLTLSLSILPALAADPGCSPAHLQHCAAQLGREAVDDELEAYRQVNSVAERIAQGGRLYSASELSEFYGAAASIAGRVREGYAKGRLQQEGGPTEADVAGRVQQWAQMRCNVGQDAPWPLWVVASEREALRALCVAASPVSQSAPRELFVDGARVEPGTVRDVATGLHVVQYFEGSGLETALTVIDGSTVGFGAPGPSESSAATVRRSSAARWPLAIGGTVLIGAGVAGLLVWGSELTPSLEENADEEILISALSIAGITLGSAGVAGGLIFTSQGPAVGLTVPL